MENTRQLMQAKNLLTLLTSIFIVSEAFFLNVVLQDGDGDVAGAFAKTLFFLLFIYFLYKGHNWSKWAVSILLVLYSLFCMIGGFEADSLTLKIIGAFYLYFGTILHISKPIQLLVQQESTTDAVAANVPSSISLTEVLSQRGEEIEYPSLLKRYQATFIDSMLLFLIFVLLSVAVEDAQYKTGLILTLVGILLLTYEPFLTCYSATLGQRMMNIRVRSAHDHAQPISLGKAYFRFFTKGLLGWISFLTIHANTQKRAMHDYAADSVMIRRGDVSNRSSNRN